MKLSEFIKQYREDQGISQRQLAAMCGLSNAYISMIENEKVQSTGKPIRSYKLSSLNALAQGIGLDLDTMLRLVDELPIENKMPATVESYPDLLPYLRKLNPEGIKKVTSYARDLCDIPKYIDD